MCVPRRELLFLVYTPSALPPVAAKMVLRRPRFRSHRALPFIVAQPSAGMLAR